MKSRQIFRKSIITMVIYICIFLYFLLLIQSYIIPNNFKISLFLLFGFAILLTGIFYFFLKIDFSNRNIVTIKILDEIVIKAIFMILMTITIFIPPISFTEMIIAWEQIPVLNFIRSIIFLIGALFIPGACIFNLIFPKSTINERLNVESFLVKITIYPLISLAYLGSIILVLDFFNLIQFSIDFFLLFSMLFLFILDIVFQKKRGNKLKIKTNKIKISRNTFLILFIGLGIIIIALGILFSSHYLIPGDRWRGISFAGMIGISDTGIFYGGVATYAKYWACISFALSKLCGIPYINTNVLLFAFLYLSITSIYLLLKALLHSMNEKYCVLSSILLAIFFHPVMLIVQFSFHTFAFFLLFISLTLFFIVIKSNRPGNRKKLDTENVILLILSSFFLFQSLITYFMPALIGIIIVFFYSLFVANIKSYLRDLLILFMVMVIFVVIFDLITYNFFSWVCIRSIGSFLGVPLYIQVEPYSLRRFLTSFWFYALLLIPILLLFFSYKCSDRLSTIIKNTKLKINTILENKYKYLFIFIASYILICLLIANLDSNFRDDFFLVQIINISTALFNTQENFLIFYLSILFGTLGIFGILGVFLSYYCFKENRNIFFFFFSLSVLLIGLASSLIFLRWMQYHMSLVSNIPSDYSFRMIYWFARTWYYLNIPLSIFVSIGLIKIIQNEKSSGWFEVKCRGWFKLRTYKEIKSFASLALVFLLIFLSISSSITTVMYWDNYSQKISDDEAQIIGWITNNVPKDSQILHHPYSSSFRRMEFDLYLYKIYWLSAEINNARVNYEEQDEDIYKWLTDTSTYGDVRLLYEEDGHKNVIFLHDKSAVGIISMVNEFVSPQTNGSISFWVKMDTAEKYLDAGLYLKIYGETSIKGIDFNMNYGSHYYYNDSDIIEMNMEYRANEWYHYQIYFDCTQKYWNVYMNGIRINESLSGKSDLEFSGNPANFSRVQISTTTSGKDYRIYFDAFNFSWAPISNENDFYDRILNDIAKLIPYLSTNNIQYFIIQKQYIDEYQELLDYFYRTKLYQYGNFIIYQSTEI